MKGLKFINITPYVREPFNYWLADIQYEFSRSEIPEYVHLSVTVKGADRSLLEVQREAYDRAKEIIDGLLCPPGGKPG